MFKKFSDKERWRGVQDDKAKKEHQSWEQIYRVDQPQTRLAGVAVPSETASRLIANVWSRGESQRYDETLQMEACVLDWCRFDLVSLSRTLCL